MKPGRRDGGPPTPTAARLLKSDRSIASARSRKRDHAFPQRIDDVAL